MAVQLYPWQIECIEQWKAHGGKGIVQVVTGAGKTQLAVSLARELERRPSVGAIRVKIIVPKTFMVGQWTDVLVHNGVDRASIGAWYGQQKDEPTRPYMIYVINSARYVVSRHILADLHQDLAVFLIADECHHYASEENRKIFEFLHVSSQHYYALGLSATPQTTGFATILAPALGPIIYTYGFHEAIKHKVISDCVLYSVCLNLTGEERDAYESTTQKIALSLYTGTRRGWIDSIQVGVDFFHLLAGLSKDKDTVKATWANSLLALIHLRTALIHTASSRVECARSLVGQIGHDAKIIVFGERIEQGEQLYRMLASDFPHQVARYHSGMGPIAKQRAIQRYREGEARILVSCKALDEGFDIPAADVGIVLSCTATERQRVQRLGRILRRADNKDVSSLYYIYLEHTIEETALFPEGIEQVREIALGYDEASDTFTHPEYDHLAERVMQAIEQKRPASMQRELVADLLNQGRLRSDWLLDELQQQNKLDQAATAQERNYWLLMMRLGKARKTIG